MASAVLVFARAPRVGEVKTRLQPALSAEQACELHRRLVIHTLHRALDSGLPVELWAAVPHHFLQAQAEQHHLHLGIQSGDNLGERMAAAAADALHRHASVLIIGCDCPWLDARYLQAADRELADRDVVLGPASDGGYVLIGMKAAAPSLFQGVCWGTDSVLASTRERLVAAGLRWRELDCLDDVDRPQDLPRARQQWPALFVDL